MMGFFEQMLAGSAWAVTDDAKTMLQIFLCWRRCHVWKVNKINWKRKKLVFL